MLVVPGADAAGEAPPRRREPAPGLLLEPVPPGGLQGSLPMRLRAQVVVDGCLVAGAEGYSWGEAFDGTYDVRIPPVGYEAIADALSSVTHFLAVRVTIDGLPTVEAIASRIRALEQGQEVLEDALGERRWARYARELGLWVPWAE